MTVALTTSQVIDGIFADAATGDLERVLSWWADDGTLEDVSIARAFVGKPAIRDYLRWYFEAMPELRYEPIRLMISGPTAMVEWMQTTPVVDTFDGVTPAPGTVLQLHAIDVFHVTNGLVAHEVSWYGDGWLRQRLKGTTPPGTPPPLPLTPALHAPGTRFAS
ncbi:MAG: SnoaL-like polyketide cyclase [Rhodoglobus sp.]|nr:SnoaL-like polyketide cyclase [Rhodoglobus sp.]